MFSEAYPDPVRVVAVGVDVADLVASPDEEKWFKNHSVEFCGGTHTPFTGEIELFCTISEEPIGQGERRINAVTGLEARKAITEGENLWTKSQELLNVKDKELQQVYILFKSELDSSNIPHYVKYEIRQFCEKNIENKIALIAKENIKKEKQGGLNQKQEILQHLKENPDQNIVVSLLPEAAGNNKVMSNMAVAILKESKQELNRDVAVMLLSVDHKSKMLIIQANVSPSLVSKGLHANNWINQSIEGGKCGSPKQDMAQGKSTKTENLDTLVASAMAWAKNILNK